MRLKLIIAISIVLVLSASLVLPGVLDRSDEVMIAEPDSLLVEAVDVPPTLFGIRIDSMIVESDEIRYSQSLSDILLPRKVEHQAIFNLTHNGKEVFDVRKIRAGRPYTLLSDLDSSVNLLVYEPNSYEFIVFHLKDSQYVEKHKKKIEVVERSASGVIENSLAVTIEELGGTAELTNRFVDVFAWQIDFWRLQKGDHFKIIYAENQVEGEPVGIEQIKAIYFNHQGNDYYAFAYDQGNGLDYFDEKGNSLRKALLKYPLEFTRISSRYSLNRFHPVQKRYKAHLGTDFAAPTGTPIRSVGDGIVIEAKYSRYNGNYVKIRHNATYTTQYLHMSRIGNGIKAGVRVRQGQLIGYVGATGLANGPHLCYRFWKNNVQVDALRIELPPSEPIEEDHIISYEEVMKAFLIQLEGVDIPALPDPI